MLIRSQDLTLLDIVAEGGNGNGRVLLVFPAAPHGDNDFNLPSATAAVVVPRRQSTSNCVGFLNAR